MSFVQDKPKKIVFFGDSITQAGVGASGYITKISQKLEAKGLKSAFELIGAGISGNKIYDLYLRMPEDVLAKSPDMVFIYIGVNDVWHRNTSGTGTDIDKFEKFYNALIKKLKENNCKVVLCTPACIGERTDFTNAQDGDLNNFSSKIRSIAKKNDCSLVDLRKIFLDYNLSNNPDNKESGILTTDRVHLNDKGNDTVASAMLEIMLK